MEGFPELVEGLKRVFANVKDLLNGCSIAEVTIQCLIDGLGEVTIQCLIDGLGAEVDEVEFVRLNVVNLVIILIDYSERLLEEELIEDVLRVEIVIRLLFSAIQSSRVALDRLAYLEKVTQEYEYFNREVLAYGYEGITLTNTGCLQVVTTRWMDSGKLVSQYAFLPEPMMVDELTTVWLVAHFLRLALCFDKLKGDEGSMPWFEAAEVAKSGPNFPLDEEDFLNIERIKKRFGTASRHSKNSTYPVQTLAPEKVRLYKMTSLHYDIAHEERNDLPLSLKHLAKAIENAAANAFHFQEFRAAHKYGLVLLVDVAPDKLGEIGAYFRQALEAIIQVDPRTSISLNTIHTATMYEREILLRRIETLPSEFSFFLPDGTLPSTLLWIVEKVWDLPVSRVIAHARALYILGYDHFYESKFDRAEEMMRKGLRVLEEEPQTDEMGHYTIIYGLIHYTLGEIYLKTKLYEEAAEQFRQCNRLHDLTTWKALAPVHSADNVLAFTELMQILSNSDLWKQKAAFWAWKGTVEFNEGDFDMCIPSLQQARKAHDKGNLLSMEDLVSVHILLLQAYVKKYQYRAAYQLVKMFQPIIDAHHKGDSVWQLWQAIKAVGHEMVGDMRNAEEVVKQVDDPDLVVLDDTNGRFLEMAALRSRGSIYRGQGDSDTALECYAQMEQLMKDSEGEGLQVFLHKSGLKIHSVVVPGEIHLNIANILLQSENVADLQRACKEAQQAALLLRKERGQEILLARALACQAAVLVNLAHEKGEDISSETTELIDEAINLVGTRDSLLLARFKYIKSKLLTDPVEEEAESREAVLIFAEHQLQLRDMESAWVSMFGFEMKFLYISMQFLSINSLKAPLKALLWAERGRTRLFVHLIEKEGAIHLRHAIDHDSPTSQLVDDLEHVQLQSSPGRVSCWKKESLDDNDGEICDMSQQANKSTSNLCHESVNDTQYTIDKAKDELWFDKDDALAETFLFQAVEQCGPKALILEYTYEKQHKPCLLIYAVFIEPGGGHKVQCQAVDVQAIIERQREGRKNWVWGTALTSLISKTREYIVKEADKQAVEGLSLLHSILIKPIETYVKGCQRLILSVHERLALVPFAALFDKQSARFLVQDRTISYIPSIRVLHYCLHRQRHFEQQMQKGLLEAPFVAGNPEPMGWGMKSLPGAAEEAKLVAEMLGVDSFIGPKMTKNAVLAGLSKASMVLLATHGIVDTYFPHGALILQASNDPRVEESSTLVTMTRGLRGNFVQQIGDAPVSNTNGNAAITSDEIASLPSGIKAGLVVLSACKSGEGEVTSEGLLGLGRALLQGGAPASILTLWEVADASNVALIAGVFEQLVKQGKDVAEALQHSMLEMMESKEKKYQIYHWAPLVVLGTPFFKYEQGRRFFGGTGA